MPESARGALRARQARGAANGFAPGSRSADPTMPARTSDVEYRRASLALHNLRGVAVAFVVATHALVAYLASNRASPYPFDRAPYGWLAVPIIDRERWLGFDIFCAWQDVYLMALWFFLAGAFAWQSLARQSVSRFLSKRLPRLGVPLIFGLAIVMPAALFPVYLVGAARPSLVEYAREYLALPFVPVGPMWFLWQLLALVALAALIRAFAPSRPPSLSRWLEARPSGAAALGCLIVVAAYAPLALAFTPFRWINEGPVAVQLCRPLLYAVYFLVGCWVGAEGLGRGLLRADGPAARGWKAWAILASLSLFVWLGLMGLVVRFGEATPLTLMAAVDIAYPIAGVCSL
ncbi:MAG: acyltransferase family protein, partial [Hyphomicrobiales bacterium]|nr:acyltransferase family protein [Hyphomicrobiales bacterium]